MSATSETVLAVLSVGFGFLVGGAFGYRQGRNIVGPWEFMSQANYWHIVKMASKGMGEDVLAAERDRRAMLNELDRIISVDRLIQSPKANEDTAG